MDINNILKKSIEFGKDFKENLPFGDNEEKYNKEFWNFITKVIKNENLLYNCFYKKIKLR